MRSWTARLTVLKGQQRRFRSGIQTLELVIAFPLLLTATLAIIQFSTLLVVETTVNSAVAEAAREAAKVIDPADAPEAALATFNKALQVHGLGVGTPHVALSIDQSSGWVAYGDSSVAPQARSVNAGEVRVTACVSLRTMRILNLLKSFGFDLDQRMIESTCVCNL